MSPDDMIVDMNYNKRFQSIFKELFIRCRKLNISFTHHTILFSLAKIHNKRELRSVAGNHSANIDYIESMEIYRKCTNKPYSFLTIDTTLPTADTLRFRQNL